MNTPFIEQTIIDLWHGLILNWTLLPSLIFQTNPTIVHEHMLHALHVNTARLLRYTLGGLILECMGSNIKSDRSVF